MNREDTYYDFTRTLCSHCGSLVDGKIVYNMDGVYIQKQCMACGEHRELLDRDVAYHLSKRRYDKPGTMSTPQTQTVRGCPYDCGLCPAHDQHTCIGLIEITGRCDLGCAMCFARAGAGDDLPLEQIEKMMDFYMAAENNNAEVLQISGGEPTLHPEVLKVIRMAKDKGFRYVMLNTNGLRLAEDEAFVKALAEFKGGFEVYLQFDGLTEGVYEALRGRKLLESKKRAVANLARHGIPATLVCTVAEGVNDNLLGELIVYGMDNGVRGVNFQPLAYYQGVAPGASRATLSGILNAIETQTGRMLRVSDFVPLPCDTERVAITFLLRDRSGFLPVTRGKDMSLYKDQIGNTFLFDIEGTLDGFGTCCDFAEHVWKRLPKNFRRQSAAEKMSFVDEHTFRLSVSMFVDVYNFDMKSMQKECVHMITPEFKRIPFSAYNMLHRPGAGTPV